MTNILNTIGIALIIPLLLVIFVFAISIVILSAISLFSRDSVFSKVEIAVSLLSGLAIIGTFLTLLAKTLSN